LLKPPPRRAGPRERLEWVEGSSRVRAPFGDIAMKIQHVLASLALAFAVVVGAAGTASAAQPPAGSAPAAASIADGGGCNAYGCWSTPDGSCNAYGCRDVGGCNAYGCWNTCTGGCNAYGCWQ
jgi:hypothetical protein